MEARRAPPDCSFLGEDRYLSEQANIQTAKGAYEAFGRGDIPAVLEVMTDDIEWVFPGPAEVIPIAGTYRGKDAVGGWSQTLATNLDFQVFEPREFIAQGDNLVSLVPHREHGSREWREACLDEAHVWTFRVLDKISGGFGLGS